MIFLGGKYPCFRLKAALLCAIIEAYAVSCEHVLHRERVAPVALSIELGAGVR